MNAKQEFLFGMLKEIDGICKRNDVQYFIVAGTLLGALRNGGFLPWDDDIDVLMTYDNFIKFQEACKTDIPANRRVCTPYEDESYPTLFPRYISTDTTSIHSSQTLHDDYAGELIDVFVLDPIADGPEAAQRSNEIVALTHDIGNYASIMSWRYDVSFEEFKKYEAIKNEKGKLAACQALEEERHKLFDPNGSRYMHRSLKGGVVTYPRSWFESTVEVTFEGEKFPAPCGFNNYLSRLYSKEWAELPGIVDPAKHDTSSSLNFPYAEALTYYHPSQNRDELREKVFQRKRNVIEDAALSNGLSDDVSRARAKAAQLEVEARVAQYQAQFDKAYEERDTVELAAILGDYMAAQGDKSIIGRNAYDILYRYRHPILIEVSDKVFEASLWVYMETGRTTRADRLLTIRENQGLPLSEPMLQVKEALATFTEAVNNCQNRKWEQALPQARAILAAFPNVSTFLKLLGVCLQNLKANDESLASEFKDLVKRCRKQFPNDGYYLKLEGDILCEEGDETAGRDAYLVAAESSLNGFALTDIQNKTGYAPAWMRNSAWGKEYGVPQWDGPTPEKLNEKVRASSIPGTKNAERYLYDLLCELTDLCDANSIAYTLDRTTASVLVGHGMLSDKVDGYGIMVANKDVAKLAKLVGTDASAKRCIERTSATGSLSARYHGRDSLCLKMNGKSLAKFNDFSIKISSAPKSSASNKLARGLSNLKNKFFGPAFAKRLNRLADGVTGHEFSISDGWEKAQGSKPATAFKGVKNVIISTSVRDTELLDTGIVPKDFFERWGQLQVHAEFNKNAQAQFKKNFSEIKVALKVKQAALDLLPQKDALLKLHEAGNDEAVRKEMGSYLKLAKKHKFGSNVCFDEELLALAKQVA